MRKRFIETEAGIVQHLENKFQTEASTREWEKRISSGEVPSEWCSDPNCKVAHRHRRADVALLDALGNPHCNIKSGMAKELASLTGCTVNAIKSTMRRHPELRDTLFKTPQTCVESWHHYYLSKGELQIAERLRQNWIANHPDDPIKFTDQT